MDATKNTSFPPVPNFEDLRFTPSPGLNFPYQKRLPSEMLACYSPDLHHIEALLTTASPDFHFVQNTMPQPQEPTIQSPIGLKGATDALYSYNVGNYYGTYMDDQKAPFSKQFPRALDYSNFQTVLQVFPHLQDLNNPLFDIESISPDAHFYIMRSSNDDNIHKAMKYHVWTTTNSGKQVLSRAWNEFKSQNKEPEVYLIFSVVNSNQFLGIAKLTSDIDHNETFKYWWEPCKWFGSYQIKWLFAKDVPHSNFEHLTQEVYQQGPNPKIAVPTSVINLRDSTKIQASIGKKILEIFAKAPIYPNILQSFGYMDRREDQLRVQRDSDPNFDTLFDEYNAFYKQNPDTFRPPNSQPYYKKDWKKGQYHKGHSNYVKYQPKQQITSPEKNQATEDQEFGASRGGGYRGKRGGSWNKTRGSGNGRGRGGAGGAPRYYGHQGYDRNAHNGPFDHE